MLSNLALPLHVPTMSPATLHLDSLTLPTSCNSIPSIAQLPFCLRFLIWTFESLLRGLYLVGPISHLLSNLVPAVMHVLQCLLVLSVLRIEAHLRNGQSSQPEEATHAENCSCLHCCVRN